MLYRIKPYLRRDTALAVLALAGFLCAAFPFVSASGTRDEVADLERQRAAAAAALETQASQTAEQDAKVAQMRQTLDQSIKQFETDREAASISSLTTAAEAEDLGDRIITYTSENPLNIVNFYAVETVTAISDEGILIFIDPDTTDARRITEVCPNTKMKEPPADDMKIPTFTYTFTAWGEKDPLIGLVGLANDTRTTRIEALEITQRPGWWSMMVCMHVPYGEK